MADSSYDNIQNQLVSLSATGTQAGHTGWENLVTGSDGIYIYAPGVTMQDLGDLLKAFLGEFDLAELVPEAIFSKNVHLVSLELTKVPEATTTKVKLQFVLLWQVSWDLEILRIENPSIEVEYFERSAASTLAGTLSLGPEGSSIDLAVALALPAGTLSARLSPDGAGSGHSAGALFSNLQLPALPQPGANGVPAGGPAKAPGLNALDLTANIYTGSFAFHVGVDDIILRQKRVQRPEQAVDVQLAIESLQGELIYTSGAQGQATGFLWGTLLIGQVSEPISLTVKAERQPTGWQFDSSIGGKDGAPITLGTMVMDLLLLFGVDNPTVPAELDELILGSLSVSFNTATDDFTFYCDVKFPKDAAADLQLQVILTHDGAGGYTHTFSGTIAVAGLAFDLVFSQQGDQAGSENFFIGDYRDLGGGQITIGDLVRAVEPDNTSLIALGDNLSIDLKFALLAYYKKVTSGLLFTMDMGLGVDISHLPLVGKMLDSAERLTVEFQPTLATVAFQQDTLQKISSLVPGGGIQLPNKDIASGAFDLLVKLQIGGQTVPLDLPFSLPQGKLNAGSLAGKPAGTPVVPGAAAGGSSGDSGGAAATVGDSDTTWFDVTQSLGPIHFQRIGVKYANGDLTFLLDASLAAVGLDFALNGLSAAVALADLQKHKFDPTFSLRGLGLDFKEGPLEIGGIFLHERIKVEGTEIDAYDGMITLTFEDLTLSAIGSYARLQGHSSVFIYLVLDYPLGGPAFFYVNGLAAGFGYNRDFLAPAIDQILDFELVKQATKPPAAPLPAGGQNRFDELNKQIGNLQRYIPPKIGQYFLAVGLRYNSFEMFDSFTLLTVAFGKRLEIDILGISTAAIPTPEAGSSVPLLAEVQIAIKATVLPEEGIVQLRAQLTRNSYILSRQCLLTGGLAFYAWFKGDHGGEFVFTLGGYHPKFHVPDHYPTVPLLGFNWQVSDLISIKGDAYFALTPHALMAGGHLEALWHSGSLRAWFKAGADFLIGWKPFTYDAEIYIDIGASLTFHFFGTHHVTVELGGDLHLWGPKFSGKVKVHYLVVSVTVSFGDARPHKEPLAWTAFRDAFLTKPASDADSAASEGPAPQPAAAATTAPENIKLPAGICGLTIQGGLVSTVKDEATGAERWIVNAKALKLASSSTIPINEASPNSTTRATQGDASGGTITYRRYDKATKAEVSVSEPIAAVGIAPMDVAPGKITSTHIITISGAEDQEKFDFIPIRKGVPAALWGPDFDPDLNGKAMVDNALSGFVIVPATPPKADETKEIPRDNLAFEPEVFENAFDFIPPASFLPAAVGTRKKREVDDTIRTKEVSRARNDVLRAMGFVAPALEVQFADSPGDALLTAPKVGTLA